MSRCSTPGKRQVVVTGVTARREIKAAYGGVFALSWRAREMDMKYRRLGKAGLQVSELSFGSWLTFGPQLDVDHVKKLMRQAFEAGVNFFDNAEAYAKGQSEELMGIALADYRREDLVVSSKIFWGGSGPNDEGLSWKHLMEGTNNALARLRVEYVDLLFCHRPDPNTPIEETVRAMDVIVRQGKAFYWGTSEWSAEQIEEAHRIAREHGCIPPAMEQPQYNMLVRERFEQEYAPLYERYGMGTTIWSPLASGILTGKYNDGVPSDSRLARESWLQAHLSAERVAKVRRLQEVASDAGCTMSQLAIAWCLRNEHVSTVILGASSSEQLDENLGSAEVLEALTDDVMARIDGILAN